MEIALYILGWWLLGWLGVYIATFPMAEPFFRPREISVGDLLTCAGLAIFGGVLLVLVLCLWVAVTYEDNLRNLMRRKVWTRKD